MVRLRRVAAAVVCAAVLLGTAADASAATSWAVPLAAGSKGLAVSQGPPSTPTSFAASCSSWKVGVVDMSWNAVSGATDYQLWYSIVSGSGPFLLYDTSTTTTYSSPTIVVDGSYWFAVKSRVGTLWLSGLSSAAGPFVIATNGQQHTCNK